MSTHLHQSLENLSITEKRTLGEALINSAHSEASAPLITAAQRAELGIRLAYHRAHPDEPGMTITRFKTSLLNASH